MPTLSIGDIAFSPLDANTLYAGTGSFSNGGFGTFAGIANGGDGLGVLKTTDLGDHWTLYSTIVDPATGQTTTFQDQNLRGRSILPTEQVGTQGQLVLAGAVGENDDGVAFINFLEGGGTIEQAVTSMVISTEYTATTGSATAFVQSLYNKLLGRMGSNSEVANWVAALPQLGRGGVALDFLGSTEFRFDVIEQLYGFPPPGRRPPFSPTCCTGHLHPKR
jgi:hypothetical protein